MTFHEMAFFPRNFMLQAHQEDDQQPPTSLASVLPPSILHSKHFHGAASFLGKRSMSFSGIEEANGDEDLSDDGSQAGEKKRRLNMEQVKTLEKSFESGNKLDPERKMQLAQALGLQPRQIAIWFQNRRARWKTKQLEKDYDILRRQFDVVKADNDSLQEHNKKLQAEILALKTGEPIQSINLNKETEGSCSNRSMSSSEINLDVSRTSATDSPQSGRTLIQTCTKPTSFAQLLNNSSRSDVQCQKVDHTEESFCYLFSTMDDHPNLWPWSDHQQLH